MKFTRAELDGVPTDVLSGYKKVPALGDTPEWYEITFKTPDITQVVRREGPLHHSCRVTLIRLPPPSFPASSSNSLPTPPPVVVST